jgi:hypothetical protein
MPPFPLDQCDEHQAAFGRVEAELKANGGMLAKIADFMGRMEPRLVRLETLEEERTRQGDRRPAVRGNLIAWLALAVAAAAGVAPYVLGR